MLPSTFRSCQACHSALRVSTGLWAFPEQHQRVAHPVGHHLDLTGEQARVGVLRQHRQFQVLRLDPFQDEARFIDAAAVGQHQHRQLSERVVMRGRGGAVPQDHGHQLERDRTLGQSNPHLARIRAGCRADQFQHHSATARTPSCFDAPVSSFMRTRCSAKPALVHCRQAAAVQQGDADCRCEGQRHRHQRRRVEREDRRRIAQRPHPHGWPQHRQRQEGQQPDTAAQHRTPSGQTPPNQSSGWFSFYLFLDPLTLHRSYRKQNARQRGEGHAPHRPPCSKIA